jgi:hypothetical protein
MVQSIINCLCNSIIAELKPEIKYEGYSLWQLVLAFKNYQVFGSGKHNQEMGSV